MEKENKKTWLIVAGLAVLLIIVVVLLTNSNKSTSTNQKQTAYTGSYAMEDRVVFENYLMENISQISPKKEVLGGKFYVTTIDWLDDSSGTVAYEDGHIALKADFKFSYADAAGTKPNLDFFNIVPDSEEIEFEVDQPAFAPVDPILDAPNIELIDEPALEPVIEPVIPEPIIE